MIALDDWQIDIIADKSKYLLLCKGRQIGGTTTFAVKAVKWMVEQKKKILVGSITEEQAKLVIVMVYEILNENYKKMIAKGKNKPTLDRIRLTNGAEIRSRPVGTLGDAFRGFTADVNWFNEASGWPEIAFAAIMPSLLTRGGEMWMDSTPRGKVGYFWKCFQNKNNLWKIYFRNSEEVIEKRPLTEDWTETKRAEMIKFLADQKSEMSALQYGQEYLGLFMEELMRFFPDELLEKIKKRRRDEPNVPKEGWDYYAGHDLARMGGDSFTAEIIGSKPDGKTAFHCDSYSEKKLTTVRNEELILDFHKIWKSRRIGIDAGSGTLGVSCYDHLLQNAEVNKKIIAMNNRDISIDRSGEKKQRIFKEDLYDNCRAMMENNEIEILDDERFLASLRSIQMEIVEDSHGIKRVRIFGTDSHRVEGFVRALWLWKKEKSKNFHIYWV